MDEHDYPKLQEHLSVGQFARPRFRQPFKLQGAMSGSVFEIDEEEDDLDLLEEIDEENYEADTLALFQSYEPADTTMRVMDSDGSDGKRRHFDAASNIAISFDEMEKSFVNLTEDGSVKKKIVKPGNGMKVPERCRIYFHYMIIAEGQSEPFDTSLVRKYPYCVDLRQGGLFAGLDIAIRSMELSEASRFIVYPIMGFGEGGCPPRIPANAKLLCIIETLQYIDEKRLNTPLYMSMEDRNMLPFEEILRVSQNLRTEGNGLYKEANYQFAIKKWRKGIQILEDFPVADGVMCSQRTEIVHTLYSNLAQAYLKLEKPAQACSACKIALKMVSGTDSIKILYRFARAKFMLKDVDAALGLVEQGLRIDKKDPHLRKLEKEIRDEDSLQKRAEKRMWKNIFKIKPKPKENMDASKDDSKNSSPSGSQDSPSMLTLMDDDDEKRYEVHDFVNKFEDMRFTNDDGNFDLDDFCPPYAYCSGMGLNNDVGQGGSTGVEGSGNVLDSLPTPFFDMHDINLETADVAPEKENENGGKDDQLEEKKEAKEETGTKEVTGAKEEEKVTEMGQGEELGMKPENKMEEKCTEE